MTKLLKEDSAFLGNTMQAGLENKESLGVGGRDRSSVLILTSSLLTDRMLLYSGCLEKLSANCRVRIWATSARNKGISESWDHVSAEVQEFPPVLPYREFPYNF